MPLNSCRRIRARVALPSAYAQPPFLGTASYRPLCSSSVKPVRSSNHSIPAPMRVLNGRVIQRLTIIGGARGPSDRLVQLVLDVEDGASLRIGAQAVHPLRERLRRRPSDVLAVDVVQAPVAGADEVVQRLIPVHVALHVGADVAQRPDLAVGLL